MIFNFLTEIVGTKDYRKPEWVAEMEEMRDALEGKVTDYYKYLFKLCNLRLIVNLHTKK